jgi:hypothetical protein
MEQTCDKLDSILSAHCSPYYLNRVNSIIGLWELLEVIQFLNLWKPITWELAET